MQLKSSINHISGDNLRELLPLKWIYWLLINIFNNNLRPKKPDFNKYKFIEKFKISSTDLKNIEKKEFSSPSRVLCNLFWEKINWENVKNEIGELNILDTGCGDGTYSLKLNRYAKGINSYRGIDLIKNKKWSKLTQEHSFIDFKNQTYLNVCKSAKSKTNIFISQSAIEHFQYDLQYFQEIKKFINASKNNTIQIHLFPSPACLWLYLFHGFRQYNLNSILKILKIYKNENCYFKIYPLGGTNCNLQHFKSISIPHFILRDFIKLNKKNYFKNLKKNILKDNELLPLNPSFYALIIHSNFKNKIF